jgi:hypothetical protein
LEHHAACREFILGVDGVQRYKDLEVRVISGHNPDLVITHPRNKRIDLTTYSSASALHALVRGEGFVENTDPMRLRNKHEKCIPWADFGECLLNEAFMRTECPLACHSLRDHKPDCAVWRKNGECERNPKYMTRFCPVACGWKNEL